MDKCAFIFPGQGSQSVGMGKNVYESFPDLKSYFDEANEVLGYDLTDIIFNGPEDELKKTENTQPALFLINAVFLSIVKEKGYEPDFVAGHSLGEYSALLAAGAITFKDGLKLVRYRGQIMEEAASGGIGRMAAIIGLDRKKLEELCSIHSDDEGVVVVANINLPSQIVISGNKDKVELVASKAKEEGAKRTVILEVSGPFHSPLMKSAQRTLKDFMDNIEFRDLNIPLVSNVGAKIVKKSEEVKELLVEQLINPVEWVDSIKKMVNNSVTKFYEVGPGKVLSGFVKRIDSQVEVLNFNDIIDFNKVEA